MRNAQSRPDVLGELPGGRPRPALTLLTMDMDAALILFSFVSFAVLFLTWLVAPRRADAPMAEPVVETAQPGAAVAV